MEKSQYCLHTLENDKYTGLCVWNIAMFKIKNQVNVAFTDMWKEYITVRVSCTTLILRKQLVKISKFNCTINKSRWPWKILLEFDCLGHIQVDHDDKNEQAGAELGQAQLKLGLEVDV